MKAARIGVSELEEVTGSQEGIGSREGKYGLKRRK